MSRVLRIMGIILGVLLVLIVIAGIVVYIITNNKINETHDVEVEALTIPTDAESIARGQYLVEAIGLCQDCHGDNLGGENFIDVPVLAVVDSSNLTSGEGGIGNEYADEDWIRAIRHGVRPDGKSLIIMPSYDYQNFTDEDLTSIIAYLKTLPPVDFEPTHRSARLFRLLMVLDEEVMNEILAANSVDHDTETPASIEPELSTEYGKYLASVACAGCHGDDMAGGIEVGGPGSPKSANLTSGGEVKDEAAFIAAVRTGIRHDGEVMDEDAMPWPRLSRLTEDDLSAIWLYIQSLPAK